MKERFTRTEHYLACVTSGLDKPFGTVLNKGAPHNLVTSVLAADVDGKQAAAALAGAEVDSTELTFTLAIILKNCFLIQ